MSRYIDAEMYITAEIYNEQYEEYKTERMTIAEFLDRYTDEGCPSNDKEQEHEKASKEKA